MAMACGDAHRGTLVLVVGPSGAGKDTVMRAAADVLGQRRTDHAGRAMPTVSFPRRVVTRAVAHAGEDCVLMTPDAFNVASSAGQFLLQWSAHGLSYGIPMSVRRNLETGDTVVINISRGVIAAAEAVWPRTRVVHITASPEMLAARIAARGRETVDEIRGRLRRDAPLPNVRGGVVEVRNEGTVAAAADALLAEIARITGAPGGPVAA